MSATETGSKSGINNKPEIEPYPVSKFYSVKDGFTISKTASKWQAVVVVEAEGRIQKRFYSWEKKKKRIWKVGLSRFELDWDIDEVARKVKELGQKWGLGNPPKTNVQRARRDLKDFAPVSPQSHDPDEW